MMNGGKVTCRATHDGVLLSVPQFDLKQIADSGQCFRISQLNDKDYLAITGNHFVKISMSSENEYVFHCSYDDFRDIWLSYFDLVTDYGVFQQKMTYDPFLRDAILIGGGIRILRQDLWETVITFVISQRNNIPRIRSTVDTLCREFGTSLGTINGDSIFSFPTADQLRGRDLSCASLGYREKYIRELCEYDTDTWKNLLDMDDNSAKLALLSMKGIGEKVANCIMLYGLHRMSSYPKDVWINRMIDDVYGGKFDPTRYEDCAGYVQQLQFYHYRQLTKGVEM